MSIMELVYVWRDYNGESVRHCYKLIFIVCDLYVQRKQQLLGQNCFVYQRVSLLLGLRMGTVLRLQNLWMVPSCNSIAHWQGGILLYCINYLVSLDLFVTITAYFAHFCFIFPFC